MIPEKLKIYLLGSGPIAVPVLEAATDAPELDLVGVGTQPDRPAGRNRKPTPTPLGAAADAAQTLAERVENVNDPDFVEHLQAMKPDFLVVVSFGQLLKAPVLELPRYGCVNIHASLLPHYRGASPIVQAIRNRDEKTGVCFMKMERGLDTGAVYRVLELPLRGTEWPDELEMRLGYRAANVLGGTLRTIATGERPGIPQNNEEATFCTKVKKDDGYIDWNSSAVEIEACCRAYSPWPGAFFALTCSRGDMIVTIRRAVVRPGWHGSPGEVLCANKHGFVIGCGSGGAIDVLELSVPGKRSMSGAEFINGIRGEKPVLLRELPQKTI